MISTQSGKILVPENIGMINQLDSKWVDFSKSRTTFFTQWYDFRGNDTQEIFIAI